MHIRFRNVSKRLKNNKIVLRNINFEMERGDFIFVVGPSGSGKTSFMKTLYKGSNVTSGEIFVDEEKINNLKESRIYELRRKFGIVFQDLKLMNKKSVLKNITYPSEIIDSNLDEIKKKADQMMEVFDLLEKKDQNVNTLSHSERQGVAIARAIVSEPDILLCDEITTDLTKETKKKVMGVLSALNYNKGTSIIFVTHDESLVSFVDKCKIYKMNSGEMKFIRG